MSLDIEWSKLDDELAGHVQQFLNRHFMTISKPAFIGDIQVTAFEWGSETPCMEITNITDPFPEFYEDPEEVQDQPPNEDAATVPTATGAPTASVHTRPASMYTDSMSMLPSPSHRISLPPSSRLNLMHSFHRSPFVAPQHPFEYNPSHSPPQQFAYFSAPTTPPLMLPQHWLPGDGPDDTPLPPPSHLHPPVRSQDWIDDDDIGYPSAAAAAAAAAVAAGPNTATINTTTNTASGASLRSTPSKPQTGIPSHLSTEMDFQTSVHITYKGDMSMTVLTELRMNYPSMMFMSLPIQLKVKSVEFEATAVVAFIKSMNRVCVSMLEPEPDDQGLTGNKDVGLESLLRDVHIESVVGDKQKQVLKNVGKIEKFIVDQLRKILDDELVFPSYQCFQLD